ncbi:MAG: alpha-glucosidase [Atopobiaceae bacterium]|nr:alpha-glucosidase [Atopobiaceae bacterium]
MQHTQWYKDAVFYQIWPRSFCDGNGDGIGDLWGVLTKLDYIASLGVTGIWFSPLYPSPQADFGYDIANYYDINPEYGDLDLFRQVLDGAHKRGLRVIMDLVVNHTSDECDWFKQSRSSRDNAFADWYIWRDGKTPGAPEDGGTPPNNWDSLFEGGAWEYEPARNQWYLHIFAKKQPDLNMDNPQVRSEVERIMRFWLDIGVDGFREDVITFISKDPALPDDSPLIPAARGMKFYNHGPHVHEYLQQFRHNVLDHYDCMTVGEAPVISPEQALEYCAEGPNQELNMVFTFEHMGADCMFTDWVPRPFDLRAYKQAVGAWQTGLAAHAWNSLYLENHDHPRIISRYGSEQYRVESGKSLACSYLFLRGTPFVYQGQEIGMTNTHLESVEESADVSTFNQVRRLRELGVPESVCLDLTNRATRDHARTPMQWDAGPSAGFVGGDGGGIPWYPVNPNHVDINVAAADRDPDSLLAFYRKAIELRRKLPVVREGSYREFKRASNALYAYAREGAGQRLLVVCSFTEEIAYFSAPAGFDLAAGELCLCGYPDAPLEDNAFFLRPYECRVYLWNDES